MKLIQLSSIVTVIAVVSACSNADKNAEMTSFRSQSSPESITEAPANQTIDQTVATDQKKPEDVVYSIRNGTDDTVNTNVGLLYNLTNSSYCTGTLIANNLVLTAAHCVTAIANNPSTISHLKFTNQNSITQSDVTTQFAGKPSAAQIRFRHKKDTLTVADLAMDIAVIKLSAPVANYNPQGIRLRPDIGGNPTNITQATPFDIVGWGLDAVNGVNTWYGRRKMGTIGYYGPAAPGVASFLPYVTANQIACRGDSGSPIVFEGYIFGTLSSGDSINCGDVQINYVTEMNANADWMTKTLRELNHPCTPLDGDFNLDNSVDGSDFMIWQRGLGEGKAVVDGDANRDSIVDSADLNIWKANMGQTQTCQ